MTNFSQTRFEIITPPSTYRISLPGDRTVKIGHFKSQTAIFDCIRMFDAGKYLVDRVLGRDHKGNVDAEFWGEVTNHGGNYITYAPIPLTSSLKIVCANV